MWIPRFRLRTLMIGIALLALPLAAFVYVLSQINAGLNAFYGPGGELDRRQRFFDESQAGDAALQLGDYAEAEARYRSALDLDATFPGHWSDISDILIGLADALVGQKRDDEAEPLYRKALKIREQSIGTDPRSWRATHLRIAETLDHYASFLRHRGRPAEAEALEARSRNIRAEWEHRKATE